MKRLGPVQTDSQHHASLQHDGIGRPDQWRYSAVLMDQSSQDNTLEGVTPPPVTPRDAVSPQSSKDKPTERSPEAPDDRGR